MSRNRTLLSDGLWAVPFSALIFVFLATMILKTQQMLFADGAFFAFTATLPNPWSGNWCDYPGRFGVFATTILPANIAYRLGLPFGWVPFLYQLLFLFYPAVSLFLSYIYLPAEKKAWILAPLLFWASIGMCTFSFPTETYVMASVFWPAFFGALMPRNTWHHYVVRYVFTIILFFSHETMVFLAPLMVIALLWNGKTFVSPTTLRDHDKIYMHFLFLLMAMALYFIYYFKPGNPMVLTALQNNRPHALDPMIFLRYPMLKAGTISLAAATIGLFLFDRRVWLHILILVGIAFAYELSKVVGSGEIVAQRLYLARTGIACTLPIFGLATGFLCKRNVRVRFPAVASVIAILMSGQLLYHYEFNKDWRIYRNSFVRELTKPSEDPLVDYSKTSIPESAKQKRYLDRFIWRWVMPYQSLFLRLPGDVTRTHLLYAPMTSYVHIQCAAAEAFASDPPPRISSVICEELSQYICMHNP